MTAMRKYLRTYVQESQKQIISWEWRLKHSLEIWRSNKPSLEIKEERR